MRVTHYRSGRQVEDAMAVVAGFISNNRNIDVRYHEGTAVCADIFNNKIRIPKLACASGISQEDLMVFRGRVYHEAGHIDISSLARSEFPKGALFHIWNAIEDVWMEAKESKKHKGCEVVFRHNAKFHNREIGKRIIANGAAGPLFEANSAMMLTYVGLQPSWELSDKAQVYFKAAYETFAELAFSKNSQDNLRLAKRILKILKQASKEYNKKNPEKTPQQQQPQPQPQPQPQNGEEKSSDNEDAQAGIPGDVDDEEEEQSGGSSGEPDENSEPDEESDKKSDDESKDSSPEEDSEEKNGDVKGDSKSKEDSEEGDEGKEDCDSGSESGGESDSDSDDECSDSDGDSEDNNSDDSSSKSKPGGGTESEEQDSVEEDNDDSEDGGDLENEVEGLSRQEALDEKIEEIIQNIDPRDSEYLSRRDLDKHIVPDIDDRDKSTFECRRGDVSVMVAAMTRTLEQALRSMARNRKERFLRRGRIDKRRLVQIARGLSKEVFYKTREGASLNTAVEIVIDESGSMSEACLSVQLLAMAIGEALTAIGVPFEITGTTTTGQRLPLDGMTRTQPMVYRHYKSFDEKWQAVRSRIVKTGAHQNNIDGEAVEYAAFRLSQRPEKRKVVFSLSDGRPFGAQGMEAQLGSNLIRVCKRCRESGIEVYGFGILTELPRQYYGHEYFLYLDGIETIGPDFTRKFTEIITKGAVRL